MPKLEAWMTSRGAPLWAALALLVCALPGLLSLPVLDRVVKSYFTVMNGG